MHNRHIMGLLTRLAKSVRLAFTSILRDLGTRGTFEHRNAESIKKRIASLKLLSVQHVSSSQGATSTLAVDVVNLRERKNGLDAVTLHKFGHSEAKTLFSNLEDVVFNSVLRDVRDGDKRSPLLKGDSSLRDFEWGSNRGNAFCRRGISEGNP